MKIKTLAFGILAAMLLTACGNSNKSDEQETIRQVAGDKATGD